MFQVMWVNPTYHYEAFQVMTRKFTYITWNVSDITKIYIVHTFSIIYIHTVYR